MKRGVKFDSTKDGLSCGFLVTAAVYCSGTEPSLKRWIFTMRLFIYQTASVV
jgi:hypothetical protein